MLLPLLLIFGLLLFLGIRYYSRSRSKGILLLVIGISIGSFLLPTYLKWEFLTATYSEEVKPIVVENFKSSSFAFITVLEESDIIEFKIFSYSEEEICCYIQDKLGNKWNLHLYPSASGWTCIKDGFPAIHIIDSASGGSADQLIYWY